MWSQPAGRPVLIAILFAVSSAISFPAAAQTSGMQAGVTFGPAAGRGEYVPGFVTGWYGIADPSAGRSPGDVRAELVLGGQDFQAPTFFARVALLLRLKPNATDDWGRPPSRRLNFLIGPQVELRRGPGDALSKSAIDKDVKLVLGAEIEVHSGFLEVRYTTDVATKNEIVPAGIDVTRGSPRLVPATMRRRLAFSNGAVTVTAGMRFGR